MISHFQDPASIILFLVIIASHLGIYFMAQSRHFKKVSTKTIMIASMIANFSMGILVVWVDAGIDPAFMNDLLRIDTYFPQLEYYGLTHFAPNYIIIGEFLFLGFNWIGQIFPLSVYLGSCALFQCIFYKMSFRIIPRKEPRGNFKFDLTMMVSSLVFISNVIFFNGINMILIVGLYGSFYLLLLDRWTLAGCIFGALSCLSFDFFYVSIGLLIYSWQDGQKENVKKFMAGFVSTFLLSCCIPLVINRFYILSFLTYIDLPESYFELNIMGFLFKELLGDDYFISSRKLIMVIVFVIIFARTRHVAKNMNRSRQLLDILLIVFLMRPEFQYHDFILLLPILCSGLISNRGILGYLFMTFAGFMMFENLLITIFVVDYTANAFINIPASIISLVMITMKLCLVSLILYIILMHGKDHGFLKDWVQRIGESGTIIETHLRSKNNIYEFAPTSHDEKSNHARYGVT